jgi:hypothetical protein
MEVTSPRARIPLQRGQAAGQHPCHESHFCATEPITGFRSLAVAAAVRLHSQKGSQKSKER